MNLTSQTNLKEYKRLDYFIKNQELHPTIHIGINFNPWETASPVLKLMATSEGGNYSDRPNVTETNNCLHHKFASCKTAEDCLVWVKEYGLPYYKTGFDWWNDTEDRQKERLGQTNDLCDETTLSVVEFLQWSKVASWILYTGIEKGHPVIPEVHEAMTRMQVQDLEKFNTYRNYPIGEQVLYQILNRATHNIHPHFFIDSNGRYVWGWAWINMMQFIFLNITADITTDRNKPRKCPCGRWFRPLIDNRREHCSPSCQRHYAQNRFRGTPEYENPSPLLPWKPGRRKKEDK